MTTIDTSKGFGLVALKACDLAVSRGMDPEDAWGSAVFSVYPDSVANRRKGCPKSAFLGLAGAGHILGIQSGYYTTSLDNKRYALDALRLLQAYPDLANDWRELWRRVTSAKDVQHNEQMSVVLALWNGRKFKCQI